MNHPGLPALPLDGDVAVGVQVLFSDAGRTDRQGAAGRHLRVPGRAEERVEMMNISSAM